MDFEALKEQHGEDAVKEAFMLGVIQGIKQAQEWRPIETAPLNEYVLLVLKHNETPLVGLLTSRDHEGGGSVDLAKDGYTVSSGMYCGGAVTEEDWLVPTHWMPMPQQPEEQ